jgi:hypothetical protein
MGNRIRQLVYSSTRSTWILVCNMKFLYLYDKGNSAPLYRQQQIIRMEKKENLFWIF